MRFSSGDTYEMKSSSIGLFGQIGQVKDGLLRWYFPLNII